MRAPERTARGVGMSTSLPNATWPEIPGDATVLVPVGSTEQHGPHLPLDTDTVIAEAVAHRVAELIGHADEAPVVVAAPIAYGASGEHQMFAGTSSIGVEVLHLVLVELTRSMRTWARRVVFVNAHGGNLRALQGAVDQLVNEGHDVSWHACKTSAVDLHAGVTETSLMLHLRPTSVRLDRAVLGNTAPLAEILPDLLAGGVGAASTNGVLGDPTGASAERGAAILEGMARRIAPQLKGSSR
jgi:mycofactocin precursor peptide peptidase